MVAMVFGGVPKREEKGLSPILHSALAQAVLLGPECFRNSFIHPEYLCNLINNNNTAHTTMCHCKYTGSSLIKKIPTNIKLRCFMNKLKLFCVLFLFLNNSFYHKIHFIKFIIL